SSTQESHMKRIRRYLTYGNVMSTLAVFLILGGATAFAATQLAKNSVGSKQLKKNSVTSAKIKNNAVTTNKIKAKAVTAAKIKPGGVGAGQLATNSVGNSQTQLVKVFKGQVVNAAPSEEAAPKVVLGSVGPFSFYGKCFQVAGGKVQEKTYIELTSGLATLGSEDGAELPTNTTQEYLSPATPEKERVMEDDSTAELNKATAVSNDEEFQATATDGTQITGLIGGTAAKSGTPAIGNGPFLAGDSCIIGAIAVFGG
ncbi:MAG: hypothetical protein ACM3NV_02140, partial [Syntrophothermus sp.]